MRRYILSLLALCLASLGVSAQAVPDSLLTEPFLRKIYINHPDSALRLLDEAERRTPPVLRPDQIAILRAMAYEITGDYVAKERCCREALGEDSIRLVPVRKLRTTVMLAAALERQDRYEEVITTCQEAIGLARQTGHRKEEADMLSTIARAYIGMMNKKEGLNYFNQAIRLLEGTDNVREMGILSTTYGEYMTTLIDMDRNEEAIEIGYRREALIRRMSELPGPPPGYIDQQYGFLYAKMATLLHKKGSLKEAQEIFRKFQATRFSKTDTGKQFAIPYLLDAGRYPEALRLNQESLNSFAGDTVNYNYLILLNYQAKAYQGTGRYDLAYQYTQRCLTVQDSIYIRERESEAQEFASQFQLKEKEWQLSQAQALSERKNILLGASGLIAILLIILLWIIWASLRRSERRNRIAAKQIDELIAQREEARKTFAQTQGEQPFQEIASVPAKEPEEKPKERSSTRKPQPTEYATFLKMETRLIEERLFLRPKFGRDELLRTAEISKNDLVRLLRTYAHANSVSDYLNNLRIEYATKLMRDKPLLSIDAIAEEAGFNSRSTFYRIFIKVWGMTPAQYQKSHVGVA